MLFQYKLNIIKSDLIVLNIVACVPHFLSTECTLYFVCIYTHALISWCCFSDYHIQDAARIKPFADEHVDLHLCEILNSELAFKRGCQ